MGSVTKRIGEITQPRGGYIKLSQFTVHSLKGEFALNEAENVHPSIVGMVVDYLTRFALGANASDAFAAPLVGANMAENLFQQRNAIQKANALLSEIKRVDNIAIVNACKLATYDVWLRNPMEAMMVKGADDTNPDKDTVQNIKILVYRSLLFWQTYGPIVKDGFTFEPHGYTKVVDSGDGDYLTADTLWDFKVSKSKPSSKHTLQLLMYWIMGKHSGQKIFQNIRKLGIFNPRRNEAYLIDVSTIPDQVIETVERDVICY